MTKKLVQMTPDAYAAKLIADNEGSAYRATLYFFDYMNEGGYMNPSEWCAAVAVRLFAEVAANQF